MILNKVAENIWTTEGDVVSFYGLPYPTRMTVIRLSNDDLWIHSPVKISNNLIDVILELGEVKYLIAPNNLHHLFLADWVKRFPNAFCYSSPGLVKKRKDITFSKELGMQSEEEWSPEIDQTIFKGSPFKEVVFFHRNSKTVIFADLIENFKPEFFNGWQRMVGKFAGILSPHGKAPLDFRLSFAFGKNKAKKSLSIIMEWNPENIIISHGECIFGDGLEFLKKSFSWV